MESNTPINPNEFVRSLLQAITTLGVSPEALNGVKIEIPMENLTAENARLLAQRIAAKMQAKTQQEHRQPASPQSEYVPKRLKKEDEPSDDETHKIPSIKETMVRILRGVDTISVLYREVNRDGTTPERLFALVRANGAFKQDLEVLCLLQVFRSKDDKAKYGLEGSYIDDVIDSVIDYGTDLSEKIDQMVEESVEAFLDAE